MHAEHIARSRLAAQLAELAHRLTDALRTQRHWHDESKRWHDEFGHWREEADRAARHAAYIAGSLSWRLTRPFGAPAKLRSWWRAR